MATKEDAALFMQILQWHTAAGGMGASISMMSPDFDAANASADDPDVFIMLMTGETIGTFVKQGILDPGLVYDLWAPGLIWARVGQAALRQREQFGVPALWENFEGLAHGTLAG